MENIISEKMLRNDSSEIFFSYLQNSIQIFTGKKIELICNSGLFSTEYLIYPELYEDSIYFIVIYRKLQYMMHSAGIDDFSLRDYVYPDFSKNKKILLILDSFINFRENHIFFLNKMCIGLVKIDFSCFSLINKLLMIKYKTKFIKKRFRINQKSTIKKKLDKKNLNHLFYIDFFFFKKKYEFFNYIIKWYFEITTERKYAFIPRRKMKKKETFTYFFKRKERILKKKIFFLLFFNIKLATIIDYKLKKFNNVDEKIVLFVIQFFDLIVILKNFINAKIHCNKNLNKKNLEKKISINLIFQKSKIDHKIFSNSNKNNAENKFSRYFVYKKKKMEIINFFLRYKPIYLYLLSKLIDFIKILAISF